MKIYDDADCQKTEIFVKIKRHFSYRETHEQNRLLYEMNKQEEQ